jgi:CBS domain containing-hemolysin-like protein
MTGDILVIVVMMVLTAFFSATEIAFVSANKLKIELKKRQGDSTAIRVSKLIARGPRVITMILIGNSVALVMLGIYFSRVLDPPIMRLMGWHEVNGIPEHPMGLLAIQTVVSTLIILVLSEYLPKAFARLNPDSFMNRLSRPINLTYLILSPFVALMAGLSSFFLNTLLKLKSEEEEVVFGKRELGLYLEETLQEGKSENAPTIDAEMFNKALEFNTVKAREFMVPRTEITALPMDSTMEEVMATFIESGHSKIIVYGRDLDSVAGFVHQSSMFRKPASLREVVQPVLNIPESMPANNLLTEFSRNRKTVAIVIDEFGGTAGLVTMEDLVEVVFGEIEDEHDEPTEEALLEKQIDDKTWLFSSRLEVYYVNREYGLDLPEEGDYTTLSGMVMHHAEDIPAVNETFVIGNHRVTVTDAAENKINTIRVERLSQGTEPSR